MPWWIWHKEVGAPASGIGLAIAKALTPQDKDLNLVLGLVLHHHGTFILHGNRLWVEV